MKTSYSGNLRCVTCGSGSHFDFNEERTYVKCTLCNKEYLGGFNELLEMNEEAIKKEVSPEIAKELKKEIVNSFKEAFKGNKNIKFK